MKTNSRNKQTLYYALYVDKSEIIDEYGNSTGQYNIEYSEPVKTKMNISASKGTSDMEQFGINVNYTKSMCTDDLKCPIDEHSILWIGKEPFDENGKITPYNYMVKQVAKSLNFITYAIKEVDVDA